MEESPGKIYRDLIAELAQDGRVTAKRIHEETGMGMDEAKELLQRYPPPKKPKAAIRMPQAAQEDDATLVEQEVSAEPREPKPDLVDLGTPAELEEAQIEDEQIPGTQMPVEDEELQDRQPDGPSPCGDALLRARTLEWGTEEQVAVKAIGSEVSHASRTPSRPQAGACNARTRSCRGFRSFPLRFLLD